MEVLDGLILEITPGLELLGNAAHLRDHLPIGSAGATGSTAAGGQRLARSTSASGEAGLTIRREEAEGRVSKSPPQKGSDHVMMLLVFE